MKRLLLLFFSFYAFSAVAQTSCGFGYKKTITINGGQVAGGPHTDFPVLISHTDADLTTAAGKVTSASGFDVVFADDLGNLLDFQLEDYNGATGEYVAWVKIPTLSNGTDVDIHMLYGKASITTDQSTTTTWSAGYTGVWHLHNDVNDHSGNGHNATNNGSTNLAGNGFTADGQDFQDPNDWLELNSGTSYPNISNGSFSITGWINSNDVTRAGQRIFCDDATNAAGGFALSLGDGGAGRLRFYMRGSTPLILDSPGGIIANNTWYHVAIVQDAAGTRRSIYVDGALVANTGVATIPAGSDAGNSSIGGEVAAGESANRFHGTLDEIRAFGGVLSANWITTEYNSQNQPTTTVGAVTAGDFYSVGAEEDIFHTTIANNDWDNVGTTWDSGELPDGIFETVIIQNNVDVDAGSGDYTVCDCQITSTGAIAVRLDISSTRVLTVTGDITGTLSGAGGTTAAINLTNTARLDVAGDVTMTRNNTDGGPNLDIQLRDDSEMNVAGNVSLNMSDGDDVYIDMEDNADLNITGNLSLTQSGGDEMGIVMDGASTLDVGGNLTISQSGGDDVRFNINNNNGTTAVLTVNGTTGITKTGGDDINLRTAGANSVLNLNGAITIDCPSAADTEDMIFDANNGQMNLAAMTASRSLDMGEIDFDLDGGNITVASLNVTSSGTLNGNQAVTIDVDESSIFTCSGNMSINMTGGDDFRIGLNRNGGTNGQFNCNGSLSITQSGGDDIDFYVYQNSQFNVGTDLTISQSGGENLNWDLDDNGAADVGGNFLFNHSDGLDGEIDLQVASGTSLNVDGSFTVNNTGGGDELLIDLNGGAITIGSDMQLNVSAAGIVEDIDLELDGDASLTITGTFTASLTGGDDIEIDLGNNSVGSTASIACSGAATIIQNQAVAGRIARLNVYDNCTFNAGGLNLSHGNTAGDLLLVHLDNTATMTITGNIDLAALGSGDIEIRGDGDSELRISGNFDRTPGSFGELDMATTATLEFFGSSAAQVFPQDVGAGGDVFDYGIVEINNSFGTAPQISMEGLATVHGGIVFIDGIVSSGAGNLLVVDDGAVASGASDDSHVDGLMRKAGTDAFEFPVGDQGVWAPIEISAPAVAVNFDAEYFFNDHADASVIAPLAYRSSIEYWTLDPDGAANVNVTLHWKDAARSFINSFTADLVVAHYNGADWESYGNDAMVAADPGSVTANGVTVFSPFTFGSLSSNLNVNPLPVELLSWDATKVEGGVSLDWETVSETNNSHFIVKRSSDGIIYENLIYTQGAGTSSSSITYHDMDRSPNNGWNYYQLIQFDYDGEATEYDVIPVFYGENTDVLIYPNPATDAVNVDVGQEIADVAIHDVSGKIVYQKNNLSGLQLLEISSFETGLYMVTLKFPDRSESYRLIVK